MQLEKLLKSLNEWREELSSTERERRSLLIKDMQALETAGTDCSTCPGFCCTYYHNSMQVSPLEAIEILFDLMNQERLSHELVQRLEENAHKFRLNVEVTDGQGRILRRNYTCPFFKDQSLGCSLSLEHKPYGCLGFNPDKKGVSTEGNCSSNMDLLEQRAIEHEQIEQRVNEEIRTSLKLYWDKKPIPTALLELISKLS
jgi:Fe-S-cluster containining protein